LIVFEHEDMQAVARTDAVIGGDGARRSLSAAPTADAGASRTDPITAARIEKI